MSTTPRKLLLTSVVRPFGGPGEGDSVGAELFHAQITRAQGPFSLRQVIRVWALDYIAQNLRVPTVILHYPSTRELVKELETGRYTHVGINFVVATFHKVREMVTLVRRHAPGVHIVLGGYGTVLPNSVLSPYCDSICREEGVAFMRRLLDEPSDTPLVHPHAPIPSARILSHQLPTVVGHVTAGLGCTNGCDFCCTSHFFKQKYVPFCRTGRDLYDAMITTRNRSLSAGQPMSGFIVIDEDFFLHHKRALQFLDCAREGGQELSIMGFGSVRGLSQFSAREIAEMGFDLIWNAFEGESAGYQKQRGRPLAELYRDLKSVGCAQLTSMIIGFPYQDEARIWSEFEQLMKLEPGLMQCLIYFAFPGTPFHQQVVHEKRYLARYTDAPDLRRWDGFAMHFEHPKLSPERVEALQRALYRADFERLGPSPLRLARVWIDAHRNLKNDPSPLLRMRAERFARDARSVLPLTTATIAFAPSQEVRERTRVLRRDILRITGEQTPREKAFDLGAPASYLATRALGRLGLFEQPGLLRTEHRVSGVEHASGSVFGLQGSKLSLALLEDAARTLARRIAPSYRSPGPEFAVVTTESAPLGPSVSAAATT